MKIELFLPKSFLLACDLYYEQPERVIQYFVESVTLPEYYAGTKIKEKQFATSFFLEFESRPNKRPFPVKKVREKYLDYENVVLETVDQFENYDNRLEMLESFYCEWHFELIKNISKKDAIIDANNRIQLFKYKLEEK